jgi:tetratricopeptide (TPR) repeat protein
MKHPMKHTMKKRISNLSLLLVLGLGLLGSSTAFGVGAPELYRASYQAEARGDYAGALGKLRDIRKSAGASYFASLRTGWLAYLARDFTTAEANYRDAIAAKPKAIEAKIGLTLVLFVGQKWRPLEAACKQVLAEDGRHPSVRARLAAAYYNLGNFPDAAVGYRKLVEEYPGELDYQTGLGWALLRLGKREEARKIFDYVLSVSPDNPNAREGMAAK